MKTTKAKGKVISPEPTTQDDQIARVSKILTDLPAKKSTKTLRDVVNDMRPLIIATHEKGYGYDEIIQKFEAAGMPIKESTLKSYLQVNRRPVEAAETAPAEAPVRSRGKAKHPVVRGRTSPRRTGATILAKNAKNAAHDTKGHA